VSHASYMRGSRRISAEFCREYGCIGCARCRPDCHREPRPATWGDAAAARALDHARRIVAGAARAGLAAPAADVLAEAVRSRARVGHETAIRAAAKALAHWSGHDTQA
jgi:hypothetical protein